MSQTWQGRPGQYVLQNQQLSGVGGGQNGAGGCDCKGTCCIPTAEAHYQVKPASTIAGTNALDAVNGGKTLPNRVAIEFYNAGSQTFEVSNQANFNYGDGSGRPVAAGASYSIAIGPAQEGSTQHYIACSTGTCDCRITELGR